ncbi:hypothetical protein PRIPAC_77242, partial [Pristionchus pacificus]
MTTRSPEIAPPQPVTSLKCTICDSPAAGVYYKVVRACDGCRSFFRRMVYRGQRNDVCRDRDNRTINECREKTNCKKCRYALCMRAGMRPWYLREAYDVFFPFPLAIPSGSNSELSVERRTAVLLQADIAHENMRLSKYEPSHDKLLTLNSLLSTLFTPPNDVQNGVSNCDTQPVSLRKKDRLCTDLACAIEYIKTFEFFPALSTVSKSAILLRSGLVLTNFTSAFSYFFRGSNKRNGITPSERIFTFSSRPIEIMHRIALSIQEASIVKALIVCNPGIDLADLPVLQAQNEEYGKMLFALLTTTRGTAISSDHSVFIQAPVTYVEIVALLQPLLSQAQAQKSHRLLLVILGQETTACPLLNDVIPVQMDCGSRRKKDRLGADLSCAVEYIKAFEFFSSLTRGSKCAIILRIAFVLATFTSSFTSFIKSTHPEADNPANNDLRVLQVINRINLSVQEASLVNALIVYNPAIEGISAADLRILKDESEAYGTMLFRVLLEKRESRAPIVIVEV